MYYTSLYKSPIGELLLATTENAVVGIWFEGAKYYASVLPSNTKLEETPLIAKLKNWLNIYFSGKEPTYTLPIEFIGTPFQKSVWEELLKISYGQTTTYKNIANNVAIKMGKTQISCQAVGTAIGKKNIGLLVPCHRVVSTSGSLSGYAGGINKKVELLKLEGSYKNEFFIPKNLN